ncbi:epidermal retinol dehydrogenase 2-like [Stegodyphus dumicola]|uniref:epidermal retinol dehydrogenase 2-like n=1 Tax=Stegodyphus dumicola TaxID=202533 RepID=UPI0015AD375E|nr:epidermal retinol dehydrogenase 2-like [Stegodyphus dumicola]
MLKMGYSAQMFVNILKNAFFCLPIVIYLYVQAIFRKMFFSRFKKNIDLTDKTILITGAGSGVGRSLAIEFSKFSTCLVLVDINKSSLLDTEKLLNRISRVFVYQCDVSKREEVYKMARIVKDEVGKVDILINNAGIVIGKRFLDLPDEGVEKTFAVNILSHFWMCKAFLPAMVIDNQGHIVSVASFVGFVGLAKLTDYVASKFAAVGFAETLSLELFKEGLDGVKITTVCPTLISSGLFSGTKEPLNVSVTPEYVAQKIVSAVQKGKEGVICVPGILKLIIILKALLPDFIFKRLAKECGLLHVMDTFQGRMNMTAKTSH